MRNDKKPLLIVGLVGLGLYLWSQNSAAAAPAAGADSGPPSGGTGFDPTIFGGDGGSGAAATSPSTSTAAATVPNTNTTGYGYDPQTGVYGDTTSPVAAVAAPATSPLVLTPGLYTAQGDTYVSPNALTTSPATMPGPSFSYTDPSAQAFSPSAASPIPTAAPNTPAPTYIPPTPAPIYIPPTSDYLRVLATSLDTPPSETQVIVQPPVGLESHPLAKGLFRPQLTADAVTGVVNDAVNQSSFPTPTFETLPPDLAPGYDATDRAGTTKRINAL